MSEKSKNVQDKLFKLEKSLAKSNPEFLDSMQGLSGVVLKDNISIFSGQVLEITMAREADAELKEAVDQVKELSAPYRESIKAIKQKLNYCILLLESQKTE